MKKTLITMAVIIFMAMAAGSVYAASQFYGKTELIYYDKNKAYNGYTLWSAGGLGWMVDMEGNLVHTWQNTGLVLYEDGHRISGCREGTASGLQELDWDGNVYSKWLNTDRPEVGTHHAQVRIFNNALGEYTIMGVAAFRDISYQEAIDNGADPECPISEDILPYDDGVIEFDRAGNLIWEWRFWNHIIQDYDPTKLNYGDPTAPENWGKLDINVDTNIKSRTGLGPDWTHVNSMDYNEELDQVIVNSREFGEIFVIDHSLTTEEAAGPAGDFIWRWGNPANYGQGDVPTFNWNGNEQLFGAHDIQWIRDTFYTGGPAIPGAGHLLIWDNGCLKPIVPAHSSVFEINPYDENGNYVWEKDAGYTDTRSAWTSTHGNLSNQVVWAFGPPDITGSAKGLYSWHISSAQRLPNGNTIMDGGEEGHFVEVTADKEVVWEYVNPVINARTISKVLAPNMLSNVFRCYRYGPDYPGLAGLDLTPRGKITDRAGVEKIQDNLQIFLAQ
jgi:hypothetical protein